MAEDLEHVILDEYDARVDLYESFAKKIEHFLDPVGDVPLVIDNFESGIVAFPHFPVGQYGEVIAIVTNNQIIREADV